MTSGWSTIFLKPLVFEVAFVFERGGVLLVSVFCHVERSRDISYYLLQEILRDWFGSLPALSALRPMSRLPKPLHSSVRGQTGDSLGMTAGLTTVFLKPL